MQQEWMLRYRFRLSTLLNLDCNKHIFYVGKKILTLKPYQYDNLKDDKQFVMNADGFHSEQDALNFGKHLSCSFVLAGLANGIGVDSGRVQKGLRFSQKIRDELLSKYKGHVRDNVTGITVYPSHPPSVFPTMSATGVARSPVEEFFSNFETNFSDNLNFLPQQKKAVDLISDSYFDGSSHGRLLLAVKAVEALEAIREIMLVVQGV